VRLVDKATAPDPAERPASAGAMELLLESALTSRAESSDGIAPAPKLTPAVTGSQPIASSGPVASSGSRRWGRGRVAVAAAIAVPLIAAAGWIIPSRFRAPVPAPRNSVVVLPFKNLTDDRGNDYLSEGIATDIVASLARLRELRVISSASVRRSRIQERSPLELGAELGVAAVLEGSVRQSGDRIRIVSQLLAVPGGEQLWSETFDRDVKDIFRIQSEVSRKIAIALRGELSQTDAARLGPVRQADFEAFSLYLKGRYHWSLRTEDGFRRSLEHFEQALQHDPNYAPAHAGLADVYTLMGVYGMMPRTESVARARAAAERAIELDPALAEAHASLGYIQKNRFEWAAADASFKRALSLKPGYSSAHHWYGISLTQQGRFAEAITELKIAVSLDPLSIGPAAQLASTLLMARRYDEAIQQAEKVLQMDASFGRAHQTISEAHAYSGRYDQALAALQQAVQLMPPGGDDQDLQADFGYIYAKSGRQADALRVATLLIERFKGEQQPVAGAISTIYAALGQTGEAFNWLDVARKRNDLEMGYLKIDPRWDPLRADPRFASYLSSVGFVE
jgi:TolB-like protein/Tfp pilus assembly protein PilF